MFASCNHIGVAVERLPSLGNLGEKDRGRHDEADDDEHVEDVVIMSAPLSRCTQIAENALEAQDTALKPPNLGCVCIQTADKVDGSGRHATPYNASRDLALVCFLHSNRGQTFS
jgi:hypothetical protein